MSEQERAQLLQEVEELTRLKDATTDFGEEMELADKIHNIKMKLEGVRPTDSYIECIGCGS